MVAKDQLGTFSDGFSTFLCVLFGQSEPLITGIHTSRSQEDGGILPGKIAVHEDTTFQSRALLNCLSMASVEIL